ncbi:MAG: DinB family protein [Gemmatimonadaceae bacterium]
MQRQLAEIVKGFESAQTRLERLADAIPDTAWEERTEPGKWSVAECVAHLNLTSEAYIPLIQVALGRARAMKKANAHQYKRDFPGLFFSTMIGRLPMLGKMRIGKVKTRPNFVPAGGHPKASTLATFKSAQDQLIALVRDGDGLLLDHVKIKSPFGEKISYNCFSAFIILVRHEQRHLDQATLVWGSAADLK